MYVRKKDAGTWGAWVMGADQSKFSAYGGVLHGNLEVHGGAVFNGHHGI